MIKLELIIEREDVSLIWGRVIYNNNLIPDTPNTIQELEAKIKVLLFELEGLQLEDIEFTQHFNVYALFKKFDYLNISKFANNLGTNPGLLRQYAAETKSPSKHQAKKIQVTLHELATEPKNVQIYIGQD